MMNRFKDQVAVVTGSARGIGRAIAQRLLAEGAAVTLVDINELLLKQTVEKLEKDYPQVWGHAIDLTLEDQVSEMLEEVYNRHTRLDIIVNCAGIIGPTGVNILDYQLEEFQKVNAVNLDGSFLITKHGISHMLKRSYGRILHLTSIGGKEGNPGMVGYAASKSGLIGLIKAVGKEYATSGITVNGLAPAVIATEFNESTDPQVLQYMIDKIPMNRLGTVEEVAAISCWLVSPEASFNTAAVFDLSGGRATY